MGKAIEDGSPSGENTAWRCSQMALIYFQQGAYVPTEQILTKGLRRAPNDYRLLAAMGQANATEKQHEAAIDYNRRSVAIAPQENIVAALGDVFSAAGHPDEAKKEHGMVETIPRSNKATILRRCIYPKR